MLLAVLEKKAGFKLMAKDVFLNITGGLKINDPSLDLSVLCSILSSNIDRPIKKSICMTGEIGLSGEIRPVTRIESRISEAEKLGFEEIIIPQNNNVKTFEQHFCKNLENLFTIHKKYVILKEKIKERQGI